MFDVTGTMWIVTLIVLFGFKSMWNHWMWGFLMGAFFMSFMGKWVRRSGVLTGAEWMVTRFGDRAGGRTARTAYALMAVVTLAAFLGYCFAGIGKFVSVRLRARGTRNAARGGSAWSACIRPVCAVVFRSRRSTSSWAGSTAWWSRT